MLHPPLVRLLRKKIREETKVQTLTVKDLSPFSDLPQFAVDTTGKPRQLGSPNSPRVVILKRQLTAKF